jgi:hypothetical protein
MEPVRELTSEAAVHGLAAVQDVPLQSEGVHCRSALARESRERVGRVDRISGCSLATVSRVREASLDEGQDRECSSLSTLSGQQPNEAA